MIVRKQFEDIDIQACGTTMVSDVDNFVPEMSLPIEDILQQFSFVDNLRLKDFAEQGYQYANTDEDDFDVEEYDRLDRAEKEEIYKRAKTVIDRYEQEKALKRLEQLEAEEAAEAKQKGEALNTKKEESAS